LVLPMTAAMSITDGQHRVVGVQETAKDLNEEQLARLDQDAIAVMITCEVDTMQVHQDFADAAKTKPLPPSQLAVYDRRNVANGLVLDLIDVCPVFRGKIDAVSKSLSKRSAALFLSNQVRVLTKTLIAGTWKDPDEVYSQKAERVLKTKGSPEYLELLEKFAAYVGAVTESNPVLREIASLPPGGLVTNSRIPELREQGWICMSTTGLQIIGSIGHEVLREHTTDWKAYATKLGAVDWSRSNPLWAGNIIAADGKILTQSSSAQSALHAVRNAIGLTGFTLSQTASVGVST
jgi:DNA sulfur modification protein DndB